MTDLRLEQNDFNAELIELARIAIRRVRPRSMTTAETELLNDIDRRLSLLKTSVLTTDENSSGKVG
jgi:hypothetical protein